MSRDKRKEYRQAIGQRADNYTVKGQQIKHGSPCWLGNKAWLEDNRPTNSPSLPRSKTPKSGVKRKADKMRGKGPKNKR